jgi:dipeptidyl aminopeptidase/acylaminoacyl peptidase
MRQFTSIFIIPASRAILFLVLILQLVTCPLWGQVLQKKALTTADYSKWGELRLKKMCPDGNWVSYTMNYRSGSDTLFVKNTKTLETFPFPLGNNGEFIEKDWFICRRSGSLEILNLKNGRREILFNMQQFIYAAGSKLLLVLNRQDKKSELIIRTLDGIVKDRILTVGEFTVDPSGKLLLYTAVSDAQNTINILELSPALLLHRELARGEGKFDNLVWNKAGKSACAFMQYPGSKSDSQSSIFYFDSSKKKLLNSSAEALKNSVGDTLNITDKSFKLQISDNAEKVFFMLKKKENPNDVSESSQVQLWNGNAQWIYPFQQKQKIFQGYYLASWMPFQEKYNLISNDIFPQFMLNGDQQYAILFNKKVYEPQYTKDGLTDYYLLNLSTGEATLFLKKHSSHALSAIPSPAGNYIAYFKDKNWWVYDIKKNIHTKITKAADSSFYQNKKEHPHIEEAYPQLGWTAGDKEILLYDTYDLWAFTPDGISARRLTNGRETKTQFRNQDYSRVTKGRPNYNGWMQDPVTLNDGLLLQIDNYAIHSGYYRWSSKMNKKLVLSDSSRVDQLVHSKTGGSFAYVEQRYDMPPRIMIKEQNADYPKLIFQSNPHHQSFYWGRSELMAYKNSNDRTLNAVLYYPAEFSKEKKYPMIVYIYEKLSNDLHNYINPSEYTGDGSFNISTFTSQGYFVLTPDISYQTGAPGFSAKDCVTSVVKEVIGRKLVNPDKIGLIGHSFGGYQADFVITQTNIFAAAVAGSAVTDLTSLYLSVWESTGRHDAWRLENQQLRMGKPFFEDRIGYAMNSPIQYAEYVTTPLFSWTGDSDKDVNWKQSVEFYLALHRLKKKQIMVVYPNENHVLNSDANLKDLSVRLHDWFDYFLKDQTPATWIKEGIK